MRAILLLCLVVLFAASSSEPVSAEWFGGNDNFATSDTDTRNLGDGQPDGRHVDSDNGVDGRPPQAPRIPVEQYENELEPGVGAIDPGNYSNDLEDPVGAIDPGNYNNDLKDPLGAIVPKTYPNDLKEPLVAIDPEQAEREEIGVRHGVHPGVRRPVHPLVRRPIRPLVRRAVVRPPLGPIKPCRNTSEGTFCGETLISSE